MVISALIFAYLVLFPFGQLPGLFLQELVNTQFRIHLPDIIVLFASLITISKRQQSLPGWLVYGIVFTLFGLVSALVAPIFLEIDYTLSSGLYALRLLSYIIFAWVISQAGLKRDLIFNSLLIITLVIAVIGWFQYLIIPDLTALKYFGWDDHYYRLISSFFDPAFVGIILVLGILLSMWRKHILISLMLTFTLAFTYSRASWIALLIGVGIYYYRNKRRALAVATVLILLVIVPFLPKPGGEGVNLVRTNSIVQKIINYEETVGIIKESPLFGVGLNNLCSVKAKLGIETGINSCSGLDNSVLFVFSTTGILGLLLFISFIHRIYLDTDPKVKTLFIVSGISVLVHSLFTHTLFYPWVMGWMAILIGVSRRLGRVRNS